MMRRLRRLGAFSGLLWLWFAAVLFVAPNAHATYETCVQDAGTAYQLCLYNCWSVGLFGGLGGSSLGPAGALIGGMGGYYLCAGGCAQGYSGQTRGCEAQIEH